MSSLQAAFLNILFGIPFDLEQRKPASPAPAEHTAASDLGGVKNTARASLQKGHGLVIGGVGNK